MIASSAQAPGFDAPPLQSPPKSTAKLTGTAPGAGHAQRHRPVRPGSAAAEQGHRAYLRWLGDHLVHWHGSTTVTFHTCPPKKVLVRRRLARVHARRRHDGRRAALRRRGRQRGHPGCAFTTAGRARCQAASGRRRRPDARRRSSSGRATRMQLGAQCRRSSSWATATSSTGRSTARSCISANARSTIATSRSEIDRYVSVLGPGRAKIMFLSIRTPARRRTPTALPLRPPPRRGTG